MARTKLRLSSYIRKRKGIGVRNIPAKKIKNDSWSNKRYLPPSTTTRRKPINAKYAKKIHVKLKNHRLKHSYLFKKLMICDCNHDTDQYSDARSKLEPK